MYCWMKVCSLTPVAVVNQRQAAIQAQISLVAVSGKSKLMLLLQME